MGEEFYWNELQAQIWRVKQKNPNFWRQATSLEMQNSRLRQAPSQRDLLSVAEIEANVLG